MRGKDDMQSNTVYVVSALMQIKRALNVIMKDKEALKYSHVVNTKLHSQQNNYR